MKKYIDEFKQLKTWDTVQYVSARTENKGYDFIGTAGHGYLIVPMTDKNMELAKSICQFGFVGTLAIYLEEDFEMYEFLQAIK